MLDAINSDDWLYIPDYYTIYRVNHKYSDDTVNSLGFRGLEITTPKPNGVFRILTIGGSTTYGTGVKSWQDTYPAQLESILLDEYDLEFVEVINGGQPGFNSWESLINLQFRGLDLEPDLLILYQNTNDVHSRLVPPDQYRSDNSGRRIRWNEAEQMKASHVFWRVPSLVFRLIIAETGIVDLPSQELGAYAQQECSGVRATEECLGMTHHEALAINQPIYYQRNLESIANIARGQGIDVVFMTWAYSSEGASTDYATFDYYQEEFAHHNDIMREIAQDLDLELFDLAKLMPTDLIYWTDGRHMSADGNRLQAELLAEYLIDAELITAR